MADPLHDIKSPITEELQLFQRKFRENMRSSAPLLDKIMHYIVRRKGKQMRPMFVFLSAKIAGEVSENTYTAASLIELLHTATLVHDDVVDDAFERRGFFSINALWKNKIAVLVGDYLLAKGLLLSVNMQAFDLLRITSEAVRQMSEGELLQMEKARRLDIKEDIYFEIIRRKTASLIAAACSAGATSAQNDPAVAEKMRLFGEKIGIAFQLKDDLLDYGNDDIGKPLGIDIKERKLTLPLIFTLNQVSCAEKRRIIYIVKNYNKDKEKVAGVIALVKNTGGIAYTQEAMLRYRAEALQMLTGFPESPSRAAMEQLVHFTTERKK